MGAALFLFFEWRGEGGSERRIDVSRGHIERLTASFEAVWLRPPTPEELKGLVDEYVREEVAIREAVEMGLDRDDTVIRKRLQQKLEFLLEDALEVHPPTEEDLQFWLEKNPEAFRSEPALSFRQVFVSREGRGEDAEAYARGLLVDLDRADASVEKLGDTLALPREVPLSPRSEVARLFGEDFASRLLEAEPGQWSGPIASSYGLHLVWVRERVEGSLPPLAEVRDAVERHLLAARRKAALDQAYERLLAKYRVTIGEEDP